MIPCNPYFNIYLHKFMRSDDDRALHDHPWWFASLILQGEYLEHRTDGSIRHRKAGSFALRRADVGHRVELLQEVTNYGHFTRYREAPTWTLIFTGPKIREWGFLCPKGWVHWRTFDYQNGCGEYA